VGAVLAEQNEEWTEGRRYMGLEILTASRKAGKETDTNESSVTIEAIGAAVSAPRAASAASGPAGSSWTP